MSRRQPALSEFVRLQPCTAPETQDRIGRRNPPIPSHTTVHAVPHTAVRGQPAAVQDGSRRSCRQASVLPRASFRRPVTRDTLAFRQLFPLYGRLPIWQEPLCSDERQENCSLISGLSCRPIACLPGERRIFTSKQVRPLPGAPHKKPAKQAGFLCFWTLSDVLKRCNGAQEGTRTPTTCVATTSR